MKQGISKNGTWAVKKGAELNMSLIEYIDPQNQRLNFRSDLAEQVSKVILLLEESIRKENNQQAIIVLNDLQETCKSIKMIYLFPPSSADLNYCSMKSFLYLEQLCLNQIPPSTVRHLYDLRNHLKKFTIVHSGITSLYAVLTPISKKWKKYLKPMITNDDLNQVSNNVPPPAGGVTVTPPKTVSEGIQRLPAASCWITLLSLTLSNCGLVKIDESLHFFPELIELDVSHNAISHIVHLQDCISLQTINLSYNRIRILSNLERTVGSIKNINLSHNEIESLDGIDKIYSLEKINLSNNLINDVTEVQYLSRLPCLLFMVFQNNPIFELKHYRLRVFREFIKVGSLMSGNRPFPELDKQAITKKELKKLRKLTFMSPTDSMVESSYAPMAMTGFDFSFDEFDEAEFEDYGDEEAVFPMDYRRSVVGKQSPLPANGRASTASPIGARSVPPFRNSVSPNATTSVSIARRSLSKKLANDFLASNLIEASNNSEFDLFRRRSTAYSRASMRFIRPPSTRKKRIAKIYDVDEKESFLSLAEVERDLKQNPNAWLAHERVVDPTVPVVDLAIEEDGKEKEKEKPASPISIAPTTDESKIFSPISIAVVEPSPTETKLKEGGGGEKTHRLTFNSTTYNGAMESKYAESHVSSLQHSEANSDKSTPSQSFSQATTVPHNLSSEKPSSPYIASIDRTNNVPHIYQQKPTEVSSVTNPNGNTTATTGSADVTGAQNHSQDNLLLKIDPYVGDNQYRNLSVLDNLELYFREQVFPTSRPCYPDVYLREKNVPSTSTDGNAGITSPKSKSVQDFSLRFVPSFAPEERFITIFCEKVIDLKDPNNSNEILVDAFDEEEVTRSSMTRRTSKSSKYEKSLLTANGTNTSATMSGELSDKLVKEIDAVIILTDFGFYLIDYNEINPKTTFAESPLFTAICALPLYKLSTCTIYFGFQRCNLGFFDDPYALLENLNKGNMNTSNLNEILAAYMIVTRDKSHTYPISTRIPQVANVQRNTMKPTPLNNVKIENKDGQLLEQIMKATGDQDISFYQLLYQTWRKKPGVRLPRSIVLTKSLILLCAEDLCSIDVKVKILDQYNLRDIAKIYHEDTNTLHIVIKFKRMNVLSSQKKWRLYTDSRNISSRIMEELKRACEEVGNPDV